MGLQKKWLKQNEPWIENPYLILRLGKYQYLIDLVLRYQYDEVTGDSWYDLIELGSVWKLLENSKMCYYYKLGKHLRRIVKQAATILFKNENLLKGVMQGDENYFVEAIPRFMYSISFHSKNKRGSYVNRW